MTLSPDGVEAAARSFIVSPMPSGAYHISMYTMYLRFILKSDIDDEDAHAIMRRVWAIKHPDDDSITYGEITRRD